MALYKGQGGAVFEIDPPSEGSIARESFDAQVANGDIVLVEQPAPRPRKTAESKAE